MHQWQDACSQKHIRTRIWVLQIGWHFSNENRTDRRTQTQPESATNVRNNNSSIISRISPCNCINFLNNSRHRANMVHATRFRLVPSRPCRRRRRWRRRRRRRRRFKYCARCFSFSSQFGAHFSACVRFVWSPSIPLLIFHACIQRSTTCIFQKYVRQKTSLQTLELTAAITFQMHFTYCTHTYSLLASRVTGESRARTLISSWRKDDDEENTKPLNGAHTHTHSVKNSTA